MVGPKSCYAGPVAKHLAQRSHPNGTAPLGRRFWALWAASTFSGMGDGLNYVALPLLAATLTHSPMRVAAVLFVARLPWLITAIPAGAYADRADRPRLMRSMDLIRAGLLAGAAILVATGNITITLVYAIALAVGVCDTFFAGSAQAVLPGIVSKPHLDRANGLLLVGSTATEQTVGPAIAGALFSLSRAIPFAADAVSFIGSAGLLLGLGRSQPQSGVAVGRPPIKTLARTLWVDMKAGVAWYRRSTVLCLVTGSVAVLAFAQAMVSSILVLFALERLRLNGTGFGLFMAGVAIGNVTGGVIAARLVRRVGTATVIVGMTVLAAVGYLGAGAISDPYLAAGLLSLEAVAVVVGNVATTSFRQRATPPDLQARVANVWRCIVWGVVPFGALTGGALGASLGLRVPFYVAGSLQLLLALVVGRPLHRLMRGAGHPEGAPEESYLRTPP